MTAYSLGLALTGPDVDELVPNLVATLAQIVQAGDVPAGVFVGLDPELITIGDRASFAMMVATDYDAPAPAAPETVEMVVNGFANLFRMIATQAPPGHGLTVTDPIQVPDPDLTPGGAPDGT